MDDKYARELIQSLSNGIDPFTGEVFPADHVCNQPEIIRALNLLLNPPKRKKHTTECRITLVSGGRRAVNDRI